jgi:hypothetical protein
MSFATYKSPFDEALSKPLISDDTQNVSTHQSENNSNNKNSILASTDKKSGNKSSAPSSAVYSKKLNVQSQMDRLQSSYSNTKEYFSNGNTGNSETQLSQDYQPPNLTLESKMEDPSANQNSLEVALLRERNEESRSILEKMNTISAISSELNSLVASQQDTIDEVEDHAYGIHDAAERGVTQLESANSMMRRNNGSGVEVFWKFFFGVIGIGGLIIAFVIFLHSL